MSFTVLRLAARNDTDTGPIKDCDVIDLMVLLESYIITRVKNMHVGLGICIVLSRVDFDFDCYGSVISVVGLCTLPILQF